MFIPKSLYPKGAQLHLLTQPNINLSGCVCLYIYAMNKNNKRKIKIKNNLKKSEKINKRNLWKRKRRN